MQYYNVCYSVVVVVHMRIKKFITAKDVLYVLYAYLGTALFTEVLPGVSTIVGLVDWTTGLA